MIEFFIDLALIALILLFPLFCVAALAYWIGGWD